MRIRVQKRRFMRHSTTLWKLAHFKHKNVSNQVSKSTYQKPSALNFETHQSWPTRGCKPKPAEFVQFAKRVDPTVVSGCFWLNPRKVSQRPKVANVSLIIPISSVTHLPSWKERPLSTCPVLAVARLPIVSENTCIPTLLIRRAKSLGKHISEYTKNPIGMAYHTETANYGFPIYANRLV